MRKQCLKLFTALVSVLILCSLTTSAFASSIAASGKCGDNAEWELEKNGLLTITGTGEMELESPFSPWVDNDLSVKEVIISEGITSVCGGAFSFCYDLERVKLPESLKEIGFRAFYNCDSLTDINIPKGVTKVHSEAFDESQWLANQLDDSTDYVIVGDNILIHARNDESMVIAVIPDGVRHIQDAFRWNGYLEIAIIPDRVTCLESGAFSWCENLEDLYIPESVTRIEDDAVFNCKKFRTIHYDGSREQWNKIEIGSKNEAIANAEIRFSK